MKVLIIKTSSLGDLVHTLPALTDAKNNIPEISFDWVAEEAFAEIPGWHLAVVKVIPIALRRWHKTWIRSLVSGEISQFLKTLRQKKYDLIIDAQGLIKSAVIARLANGTISGYAKNSIRDPRASFFYHNKYTVANNQHAITRIRQLFAHALKYDMPTTPPVYGINEKIFPTPNHGKKYLVFCHGTSNEKKCWQEQKWIELAKIAVADGFIVYLPWGNRLELERAQRISANHSQVRVLSQLNLTAMAALISNASGVVAPDTGFAHVAVVFDLPTILLYGPTDPKLSGAVGGRQLNLSNCNVLAAPDVWREMKKKISN